MFRILTGRYEKSAAEAVNILAIDLKSILTWQTSVTGCLYDHLSLCPDSTCTQSSVTGLTLGTTAINQETGILPDAILKIDTSTPRTENFYIKTVLPNNDNVIKKVRLQVCGEETMIVKIASQKIDQLVADEWKTFTFSDIFEINDIS